MLENNFKRILFILVLVFANVAADQITKSWARKHVRYQPTQQVVGDYFILQYAENDGAFLSLGSNLPGFVRTLILTILPTLVLIGILVFVITTRELSLWAVISVCCIVGGGIGNLYDRIFHDGLVTDFMNMGIGNLRTGIFNVADMSIMFGIAVFFVTTIFNRPPEEEEDEKKVEEATSKEA